MTLHTARVLLLSPRHSSPHAPGGWRRFIPFISLFGHKDR